MKSLLLSTGIKLNLNGVVLNTDAKESNIGTTKKSFSVKFCKSICFYYFCVICY